MIIGQTARQIQIVEVGMFVNPLCTSKLIVLLLRVIACFGSIGRSSCVDYASMKLGEVSVVLTRSKGRTIVAKKKLKAGTLVVVEDPVACVPFEQSSIPALSCDTGEYRLTAEEKLLKRGGRCVSVDDSGLGRIESTFVGNLCMLASRFYIYGTQQSTGAAGASRLERYRLINNHVSGGTLDTTGLQECAQIVMQLINSSITSSNSGPSQCIVTIADCVEIINKLSCNLFTIVDDFQNEAGIGCYPYAALINHSCEPNCIQRFDSHANILIRCVADIEAGEELTISYIDTGRPTWYRQRELLKTYHFHCQCTRCTRADSIDGYTCTAENCHTDRTGAKSSAVSSSTRTSEHHECTHSTCGICYATSSTGEQLFRSWLGGNSNPETVATRGAHPKLPFPYMEMLPHADFQCRSCSAVRSGHDIAPIIDNINKLTADHACRLKVAKSSATAARSQELLWLEIEHSVTLLQQLHRVVGEQHYCVLIVRKQLKEAMEKYLPVRDGTLMFPALTVRAAFRDHINSVDDVHSKGHKDPTLQASKPLQLVNASRNGEVVIVSAVKLRGLYEQNMQCILLNMPHCYSAKVPNLCCTYYRIQYVWFVLSKPHCVLPNSENSAHNDTVVQARELLAGLPALLLVIKTVYGEEHAFYMDMVGRQRDLAVLLRC